MSKVNLYDVFNNGYQNSKSRTLDGYEKDKQLSNHNQQVYFNPKEKKLLVNVAGTHNFSDIGTDAYLAVGKLKDTNRYKQADRTLKNAKLKYSPSQTSITGHSLGGAIAGYIASNNDRVTTLNSGYTIGQKTKKNRTEYQVAGDVVSTFGSGRRTKLLSGNYRNSMLPSVIGNALPAHTIKNIKKSNIFI
jgi:hypothetical protein